MAEKRCTVVLNSKNHGDGRLMMVPPTMEEFLKQAGEKLGISAKKAFSSSGVVISDLASIKDGDQVFISAGENFHQPESGNTTLRTFNIAVLGPGGVGKSSLSTRYVKSVFVELYDPTIEDAFSATNSGGWSTLYFRDFGYCWSRGHENAA
eukprot:TRINITY_DN12804_c0_g1_i1.p2 TRINITY_DN12804_c0_g1~~TRINITY_DN12804_c0_g1_i1.p2  ORF type:complete len:151 (-),score=24.49 TRINITY_DN12804_c0_g1_i1:449-901(-)